MQATVDRQLTDNDLLNYLYDHHRVQEIRRKAYDWYGTMNFNRLDRSRLEELVKVY